MARHEASLVWQRRTTNRCLLEPKVQRGRTLRFPGRLTPLREALSHTARLYIWSFRDGVRSIELSHGIWVAISPFPRTNLAEILQAKNSQGTIYALPPDYHGDISWTAQIFHRDDISELYFSLGFAS
uniref:Uncharacterized protein n=1 Tax=Coccidioides posadasii RMSCC 3488 TaxID=454284 RepID=A0A0J6F6D7_COCPO|nr:hypothetical protein CPAG_04828 [Coccidioides posadasii RMSCC 3488]